MIIKASRRAEDYYMFLKYPVNIQALKQSIIRENRNDTFKLMFNIL